MIQIKVMVDNSLLKPFTEIPITLKNNLNSAIKDSLFLIQATAKKKIQQGSRKGRTYRLYRGGRRPIIHQASAPGEPPKSDTGRLANSIGTEFRELEGDVGTSVSYGEYLEGGTSKMQPRPWLEVSGRENEEKIQRLIDRAIKDALT